MHDSTLKRKEEKEESSIAKNEEPLVETNVQESYDKEGVVFEISGQSIVPKENRYKSLCTGGINSMRQRQRM
mgnify:CR=1 FL=1